MFRFAGELITALFTAKIISHTILAQTDGLVFRDENVADRIFDQDILGIGLSIGGLLLVRRCFHLSSPEMLSEKAPTGIKEKGQYEQAQGRHANCETTAVIESFILPDMGSL